MIFIKISIGPVKQKTMAVIVIWSYIELYNMP